MKRNQLEVGKIYAYQGRVEGTKRLCDIQKVEVISLEPHERSSDFRAEIRGTSRGNGVLVDSYSKRYDGVESKYRTIVQLGKIIKDWDTEVSIREEWGRGFALVLAAEKVKSDEKAKYQKEIYDPAFNEFKEIVQKLVGQEVSPNTKLSNLDLETILRLTDAIKKVVP